MPDPNTPALTKDAKNRSWRTFLQGLVAAVVMGVWPVVNATVTKGITTVDWSVAEQSVINAAVTAAVTFLWRRFLDPSRIPSATPPG